MITDSCIVSVPSAGSPGEALSILRAKEKVQAALAEVANHKEREMVSSLECSLGGCADACSCPRRGRDLDRRFRQGC
jgi:hypothetical protein